LSAGDVSTTSSPIRSKARDHGHDHRRVADIHVLAGLERQAEESTPRAPALERSPRRQTEAPRPAQRHPGFQARISHRRWRPSARIAAGPRHPITRPTRPNYHGWIAEPVEHLASADELAAVVAPAGEHHRRGA
jgi:hypothetical protein